MMIQKEFFDGEKGASMNMQTGKKELTAEEIAEKKKTSALIPEMNYAANGMVTELLGIENQNGTEMYVLKIVEGENTSFDYFDVKTFQKLKTVSIVNNEGETIETSRTYSDYKAVNGVLFPYKTTIMMGEMGLNGEVKTIEINGKVDAMAFE